ncbi:MAG: flippase [archaeon]
MRTVKRIFKNFSFLLVGSIIQKFLTLVLIVYIAHRLGIGDFGVYSFILSFVILFTIFGDLGVSVLIFREIPKNKSNTSRLLGDALAIKLLLMFFVFVLAFLSLFVLNLLKPESYPPIMFLFVFIMVGSMVLDSLAGLFRTIFFAFERMEYDFIVNTAYKIVLTMLSFFVLFLGYGLLLVFLVAALSSLLNLFLSVLLVLFKFPKPVIRIDFKHYKAVILRALPFCFIAIFASIYGSIDSVMLSFFKGNIDVGYYNAANRLTNSLAFIPSMFVSSMFPIMSSFFAQRNKSLLTIIKKSFTYLLALVLPIAFGTTLLAGRIIALIYPTTATNDFSPASIALLILVWFSVFSFINIFFLSLLTSTAYEKRTVLFLFIALIFNVVFNLFLIPIYSFAGAAIASVLSELIFFISCYYLISKYFKFGIKGIFGPITKILIGCLLMVLFIYLFFFLNLFILVIISAFIYFFVIFLLRLFDKEDKLIIKKLFFRGNL